MVVRHSFEQLYQYEALTTGVNAEALGFGLKEVALTFSLNDEEVADVGEAGTPSSAFFGVALADAVAGGVAEPFPLLVPDASAERFPLKGGIGWMIIFFGAEAAGACAGVGAGRVVVAAAAAAAAAMDAVFTASLAAVGLAAATGPRGTGGRRTSGFKTVGNGPRAAAAVVIVAPIARAPDDSASFRDFSSSSFCFISSFAKIGTKSSGIGRFSW
jgi:hypothetical protein